MTRSWRLCADLRVEFLRLEFWENVSTVSLPQLVQLERTQQRDQRRFWRVCRQDRLKNRLSFERFRQHVDAYYDHWRPKRRYDA